MKTLLLTVGLSLLLAGCGGVESDARKAVLGSLKDPDSAKFGRFTQVNEKDACLTVNARNSMGGYTGDQQATLMQINKEWVVSSIDETNHDKCISNIKHAEQQHVLKQQHNEQLKVYETQLRKCLEIKDYPGCPKMLKDCPDCPDMMEIPAGSFDMGEPGSTHRVTLNGFALGKTEVTQGQWKAVMGTNPSEFKNCGDTCPVENVSWNEAQKFIQKLNAKTGKQYRLPSEAEWEYACRAGGPHEYCGSDNLNSVGWYGENSSNTTHPVAQKQANAFGLYDMSGNVWEWVEDSYHANYNGAPGDGTAWQGDGACCALRGGSWLLSPDFARSAKRFSNFPAARIYDLGFRVAKTLP